jgi:predicted nucleic acid-binding Zn ribbon protein
MSEKRSWDIQPKAKERVLQQPAPAAPVRQPVRRPAPAPQRKPAPEVPRERPVKKTKPKKIRRERVSQGREREPLKDRRRRERRRVLILFVVLVLLAIVGAVSIFWIPIFRIQHVNVAGPNSDGMQTIATSVLSGSDHYVLPRNSIFLFPAAKLRDSILKQYPDISAVSISRTSFDSISIASIPREQAFVWCGAAYAPAPSAPANASSTITSPSALNILQPSSCYSADGQGVIFASLPSDAASTTNALWIYAPLDSKLDPSASPLGASVAQASSLPNVLQFIKILKSLGAPITTVVIRGDEVDFFTQTGTRITYVLGREEMAKQLAESSFPSLSPGDGSLEYIDLRFDGKVYFKKVGSTTQTTTVTTSKSSSASQ